MRGDEGRTSKFGMICLPNKKLINKKFINFLVKVDTKDKNFNLQHAIICTNYSQDKLVGNINEHGEDEPHYLQ